MDLPDTVISQYRSLSLSPLCLGLMKINELPNNFQDTNISITDSLPILLPLLQKFDLAITWDNEHLIFPPLLPLQLSLNTMVSLLTCTRIARRWTYFVFSPAIAVLPLSLPPVLFSWDNHRTYRSFLLLRHRPRSIWNISLESHRTTNNAFLRFVVSTISSSFPRASGHVYSLGWSVINSCRRRWQRIFSLISLLFNRRVLGRRSNRFFSLNVRGSFVEPVSNFVITIAVSFESIRLTSLRLTMIFPFRIWM